MLQILLLVLKILGILLASVIGLIILAALLVLLVPVRYRAWGAGNFQNKEFEGDIRLTWLFHFGPGHVDGRKIPPSRPGGRDSFL